jgi:hypothetical protein
VNRTAIFACADAREPHWQLGHLPPATGRFALIGWKEPGDAIEAGVPEAVAHVLARAFTAVARVMFLADPAGLDGWTPLKGDAIKMLASGGMTSRLAAKLRGAPPEIALVSTRHPETAIRLFDDAGFPWWQQGQIVLLCGDEPSHRDGERQDLAAWNRETLLDLFDDDWASRAVPLASKGVMGAVRPGVDGDVAGLLSLTDGFLHTTLEAIARQTRLAGFDWEIVSEKALALR